MTNTQFPVFYIVAWNIPVLHTADDVGQRGRPKTPVRARAVRSNGRLYPSLDARWYNLDPHHFLPRQFPDRPRKFEIAISQLIHHPEYNSTLILRSEVVEETESDFVEAVPRLEGYHPVQCIHRRLLPRRPGRDAALEQYCSLHASESGNPHTLILTPILAPGASLPYYHPSVSHLAFRYIHSPMNTDTSPRLRIEALPLPDTPTDLNSRLYRTCLALLDTLHRYGWGAMTNYKKRVQHDCLVSREAYQDLYLVMRERHKGLVDTWQEVTDPLKHVFEDIGIATYLMLLWKDTFSTSGSTVVDSAEEPWKSWPRPPGGFLDLGYNFPVFHSLPC